MRRPEGVAQPPKPPAIPQHPHIPTMSQFFDKLAETIEATRGDVQKAEDGNKAATSRVRKSMQEIKNLAQDIRKEMLELRDAGGKQG